MKPKTAELWAKQDQHQGDRWRLFRAVADAIDANTVLYPGCYVDIAPSFVFESVTYLDIDKRAPKFFADTEGRGGDHLRPPRPSRARPHVHPRRHTGNLDIPNEHFDLLVSLYAGFISEHCTRHLKIGGTLLVNPSHGDAAMASIDPRYGLTGVVISRSGSYRVDTTNLNTYLIPKRLQTITADTLHETGHGVGYTK